MDKSCVVTMERAGGKQTILGVDFGAGEDWFRGVLERRTGIKIDKIFVNQPVVVVLWSDGTRTKSTCDANDQFDPFVGVSVCMSKKMVGKDRLQRLIKKAMK